MNSYTTRAHGITVKYVEYKLKIVVVATRIVSRYISMLLFVFCLGNELKPLNEVNMKIENKNIIKCDTAISIESLFLSGAIAIQNTIFTENSAGIIVKTNRT